MELNFWPFNKSKKEEELKKKKKKKKIIIWCSSIGSIVVLGGGGVGLYFVLKPKKDGDGGTWVDNWFPKGSTKLIDVSNVDLSNQYFVCPNPLWEIGINIADTDRELCFLSDNVSTRTSRGEVEAQENSKMYFTRKGLISQSTNGHEMISIVKDEIMRNLGWSRAKASEGGTVTEINNTEPEIDGYSNPGFYESRWFYFTKMNTDSSRTYWTNCTYIDITNDTKNQSFNEWLQKCYFTSKDPDLT